MSNHTAVPFRVHNNCGRKGEIGITADDAPCLIAIMANCGRGAWPLEAKANAEFIVRACNAHDEMLAALREVNAYFEIMGPVLGDSDRSHDERMLRNQVRDAISKAKKENQA